MNHVKAVIRSTLVIGFCSDMVPYSLEFHLRGEGAIVVMMKMHYKWIALMAMAATPLLSNAGPISVDSDSDQGAPQGLHIPGLNTDGDKDDQHGFSWSHDHWRPSHGIWTDFSDRWSNGHHNKPDDDHDRYSNRHCPPRPPGGYQDNRDGTDPVPESASTVMLLGGTFVGLLAFARSRQIAPANAKVRSMGSRR